MTMAGCGPHARRNNHVSICFKITFNSFIGAETQPERGFAAPQLNRRFTADFRTGNSGLGEQLHFFGMDQDPGTVAARDDRLAAEDFDEGLGGDADPAAPATLLFDQDYRRSAPFRDPLVVSQ